VLLPRTVKTDSPIEGEESPSSGKASPFGAAKPVSDDFQKQFEERKKSEAAANPVKEVKKEMKDTRIPPPAKKMSTGASSAEGAWSRGEALPEKEKKVKAVKENVGVVNKEKKNERKVEEKKVEEKAAPSNPFDLLNEDE
jgi:hypothetical protein